MNVRTRIAPSPTGNPHIGTIYQALFDYAFARKHDGQFIVRLEDTDQTRFVEDAEANIYRAFDWFNLAENESPRKGGPFGPYRQSERLEVYQKYAKQLVDSQHAYYCFCTKERLDDVRKKQQVEGKMSMYDKLCRNLTIEDVMQKMADNNPYVIRLKIPEDTNIIVTDQIRGEITFDSNTIDDQVLLKSDGYPTYHLAVVIDDHLMQISHIVRAEEWLPSTPKHVLLYQYLEWEMPPVYHTATLRNPDKSKLSKRHGHTNVDWYRENGYLPEAILNFLTLLGWSHPEEKEIFSLKEFIQLFDLKDIKPIAPIFDLIKLTWMNQQYIQHLPEEELLKRLKQFYPSLENYELLKQLLPLIRERMQTLKDFEVLAGHFFSEPVLKARDEKEKEIAKDLQNELSTISEWRKDNILATLKNILTKHSVRMPIIYYLLTGYEKGLPLPESLEILGKDKSIKRLNKQITQ